MMIHSVLTFIQRAHNLFLKTPIYLTLSFLLFISTSHSVRATDDFCKNEGLPVFIYAKIPITSAGNLKDFLSTNNLDRFTTLEDILYITPQVAQSAQASLAEIQEYLTYLNDFYDYMLNASSEDIGRLISERLMGEIDALYFTSTTPNRQIIFQQGSGDQALERISHVAYGNYSFIGTNSISLTLKLVRLSDGETRTFISSGAPLPAIERLAFRIFDAFQFPATQSISNPFSEKNWIGGPVVGAATEMRVRDAQAFCEGMGARLPSRMELLLAYNLGPYISGARLSSDQSYVVTEDDEVKVFWPGDGSCFAQTFDMTKKANVLCLTP
jgi:hypothetical protein